MGVEWRHLDCFMGKELLFQFELNDTLITFNCLLLYCVTIKSLHFVF